VGGADDATVQALEADGVTAATDAHVVGDLGDGADGGVLALVTRDEDDAGLVADVDGEGDVHAREDDGVLQRDEQQIGHGRFTLQACSRYRNCTYSASSPAASRAASRCGCSSTRTTRPSRM
jgi:hypothetical protein